jgi:energy-coupling factor transporter ATP-binding protein EcfA2
MKEQTFNYYKDQIVKLEDSDSVIERTSDKLIPGFYKVHLKKSMFGEERTLQTTEHKIPNNSVKYCERFLDMEYLDKLFSERSKMIHQDLNLKVKVGYLLHGKQGSGKTTTMLTMSKLIVDKYQACVFSVSDSQDLSFILKVIEIGNKISSFISVILFDECEDEFRHNEAYIKRVLDGDLTPDNTIFICSTNYIEQIPVTIKDRPSRFKYVTDVSLVAEEELVYSILCNMNLSLREEIKLKDEEIKVLTRACGLDKTIDQIKNMFTDFCFKSINLELIVKSYDILKFLPDYKTQIYTWNLQTPKF